MAFESVISKDLRDEKGAKKGYLSLSKKLKAKGLLADARTVKSIAKDEGEHFKRLSKIRKKLSG